jgi:hypothetical protein
MEFCDTDLEFVPVNVTHPSIDPRKRVRRTGGRLLRPAFETVRSTGLSS